MKEYNNRLRLQNQEAAIPGNHIWEENSLTGLTGHVKQLILASGGLGPPHSVPGIRGHHLHRVVFCMYEGG
jgi:hypothetical protein